MVNRFDHMLIDRFYHAFYTLSIEGAYRSGIMYDGAANQGASVRGEKGKETEAGSPKRRGGGLSCLEFRVGCTRSRVRRRRRVRINARAELEPHKWPSH